MTAHLMCLTSSGGLPLFTRKRGDGETLPFSIVASLNGVHMFGKSQNMVLKSTSTEDMTVVWQTMEDSLVLIAAAYGASESLLEQLLTSVFHAMVLTVGIGELRSPRNIERLKRELRACYPLLDRLLECLDSGDRSLRTDLLGLVEIVLCSENYLLQNFVEAYAESVDSLYGCLMVRGRVAVATASWWELHPEEKKLLSLLVSGDDTCTARDIPVFLPLKSPSVPFRLVTVLLAGGAEACVLCGPAPSLGEAEQAAARGWRGALGLLRSAAQSCPRGFPAALQLDTGVMGLLLIDRSCGKFLLSRNQSSDGSEDARSPSGAHRLDVLRTFYHQAALPFFAQPRPDSPESTPALETYWCSEYHKCHALRSGVTLLLVLYGSAVPVHTMRLITRRTLKFLTSDKQLCW
ncbi:protein fuzzy homolog [Bacillus rossius redtenbacheri]|uniref:protein fuzzy homolog n=1 Tax=Bacillus rossius redtenbacheri TaxID=93214 RepID=UPI002FDDED54